MGVGSPKLESFYREFAILSTRGVGGLPAGIRKNWFTEHPHKSSERAESTKAHSELQGCLMSRSLSRPSRNDLGRWWWPRAVPATIRVIAARTPRA